MAKAEEGLLGRGGRITGRHNHNRRGGGGRKSRRSNRDKAQAEARSRWRGMVTKRSWTQLGGVQAVVETIE